MSFKNSLLVLAVAAGSTIGLAASPGQTPGPAARQPEAAPASTQKPAATGIAECDKYFELADACMASNKMTAEEKKATQANVDRLRAMAPLVNAGQGRASLVDRCVKSLELAEKDDKYGCYKTSIKKQ
jgi:hypothetical protein